jgi:hypothetical protein
MTLDVSEQQALSCLELPPIMLSNGACVLPKAFVDNKYSSTKAERRLGLCHGPEKLTRRFVSYGQNRSKIARGFVPFAAKKTHIVFQYR